MSSDAPTPDERADRVVDDLERQSERLEGKIKDTRQDWARKRADDGVPGAPPPEPDASDPAPAREADSPAPEAAAENAGPAEAQTPPGDTAETPADDDEQERSD
ncbi:MAG: hypothetical protein ACR2OB_14350 [Solirubrobacteraceae bacterium]